VPTQVYRVTSRVGLGTGDTYHPFASTVFDDTEWLNVVLDVGEDKSGNRREAALIYQLGPTVEDPGFLSIPVGATINSAKLTVLPTLTVSLAVEMLFATILPDAKWNVADRVNPKHFLQRLPLRITGAGGTIGQSDATINTSSFGVNVRKYTGVYGSSEIAQIIAATATDTLVSVIANVSRNGTGFSGVNLWCEIWSVDGNDDKVALLATSALIPSTSVPSGFNNPTTFTFSGGPTLNSGTRYLATIVTNQAAGQNWLIAGIRNATVTAPLINFGTFDGFMWGSYSGRSEIPQAFVLATDTPSANRFASGSTFFPPAWTNGVPADLTTSLVTLLQGWIDSPHYVAGGRIFLVLTHTLAGSATVSERLFASFDSAVSDGALLEITWTDPPPPVGFPAACVHAGHAVFASVGAGALAVADVASPGVLMSQVVGASSEALGVVDETGASAELVVNADAETCPG
jgi:hypothetical protein